MCNPGAVSVAPKTDVNTVTGNSSSSDHSVKDSTNTEVNIQVTTSFAFLVLCCLILLLLVVYYLWSKHHHRVLHNRIENLSYLTGHHPNAEVLPLTEVVTVDKQGAVTNNCTNAGQS